MLRDKHSRQKCFFFGAELDILFCSPYFRILKAFVHSVILYFIPHFSQVVAGQDLTDLQDGDDLSLGSTTVFFAVSLVPNLLILTEMKSV